MPIRLSGKEIVSALGKNGWLVARVSGTLGSICRSVGLTAAQLRDLL
jgi:hypothetical protein